MAGVTPNSDIGVLFIPPTIFSPVAPLTLRGGADGDRCRADSAVKLAENDAVAETTDGGLAVSASETAGNEPSGGLPFGFVAKSNT
jgi:hypothetical protein